MTAEHIFDRDLKDLMLHRQVAVAQGWTIGGGVAAGAGFLLPWLRPGPEYDWWFSGLTFFGDRTVWWAWPVLIGYLALLLGAAWGLPRGCSLAGLVALLALILAGATLVLVVVACAYGVQAAHTIDQMQWGVGLLMMFIGVPCAIWGACGAWAAHLLDERYN